MEDFGALVGGVLGVVSAGMEDTAGSRIGTADTADGVGRDIKNITLLGLTSVSLAPVSRSFFLGDPFFLGPEILKFLNKRFCVVFSG